MWPDDPNSIPGWIFQISFLIEDTWSFKVSVWNEIYRSPDLISKIGKYNLKISCVFKVLRISIRSDNDKFIGPDSYNIFFDEIIRIRTFSWKILWLLLLLVDLDQGLDSSFCPRPLGRREFHRWSCCGLPPKTPH